MNYKINYKSHFNKNGTHYNQTITINVTSEKYATHLIKDLNFRILKRVERATKLLDTYTRDNLRCINISENNVYYLTSSQLGILTRFLNYPARLKQDRNTILIINIR